VKVILEPWAEHHLDLLKRTNVPEMKKHLGGPESDEKILERHGRYLKLENGQMFAVLMQPEGEQAGSIGFWERTWQGETVYETGWGVLPEFQGQGVAKAAVAEVIEEARQHGKHRYLHAFPRAANEASNGLCRGAGFQLLGPCDFEFPPGTVMTSNDWRIDLSSQ